MGKERLTYPGAIHHIICRGNDKHPMFHNDNDRFHYLDLLKKYSEKFEITIMVFCLMENHTHLLIETVKGNISKFMHSFNTAYVNWYNKKWNRTGHVFEGKFKSPIVNTDRYLSEVSRYIHLNSAAAGLVSDPIEYFWSSCKEYIGEEREKFSFISKDKLLSLFGDNPQRAKESYKKFVNDGLIKIKEEFEIKNEWYKTDENKLECGDMGKKLKRIIEEVAKMYELDKDRIIKSREFNYVRYRQAIMYLAKYIHKFKLFKLGEFFEVSSRNVKYSIKKIEIEIEKSEIFAKEIEMIKENIMSDSKNGKKVEKGKNLLEI